MKITPIEIKQKTFATKSFGKGYDKEEVNAFLLLLSQEWEKKTDHNKELQIKVELLEKEIDKLKEVESSLFRTLKTAEDTSNNIVDQARKTAELKVKEAQLKADVVLNDAREQAKTIVHKAQLRARDAIEEMMQEVRKMEQEYKEVERYRDHFIVEMRGFMKESLEKVDKYESKQPHTRFKDQIKTAEQYLEDKHEFIDQQEVIQAQEQAKQQAKPEEKKEEEPKPEQTLSATENNKEQNSFFEDMNS